MAVPDERLQTLSSLHSSRKTVSAQIELIDVHATAKTPAAALARLRDVDALVAVLPSFGGQDGEKELAHIKDELLLADMGPVDTRLRRALRDPAAKKEVPSLEAAMAHLEQGLFMSRRRWEDNDSKVFSPLALITLKPLIVVYNIDETQLADRRPSLTASPAAGGGPELGQGTGTDRHTGPAEFIEFSTSAALEAEVAGMTPDEARDLLGAYGVEEPVLSKLIQAVYRSLDLISFFTTGEDESRAWEVRQGASAPEAAGVIHSDIQRGFIRAEVIGYDKLVEAGSWDAAKSKGLIRVEGKDYVFREGDVTNFRFAV